MLSMKRMTFFLAISLLLFFPSCKSQSKGLEGKNIKRSKLAGSWYPAGGSELRKEIEGFLKTSSSLETENILAMISPHAGYVYSGQAAAYGYKALKGKDYKRIFIFAPSHYAPMHGFSVSDYDGYETPLGIVNIDRDVVNELKKNTLFVNAPKIHEPEHAIEIQLPFLQSVLKDFKVVPVLFGELYEKDYDSLAGFFRKYVGGENLFVVSSDFTHYGQRFDYEPFKFKGEPTKEIVKDELKKLDSGAVAEIERMNFRGFTDYTQKTGITICGRVPIALLLKIFEGIKGIRPKLLDYYTSIDSTGDHSSSVSYVSMVFLGGPGPTKKGESEIMPKTEEYKLSGEEKRTLLEISRDTLKMYLSQERYPTKEKYKITPNLEAKRGVFVTLTENGDLRGCIGYIEGIKPVYQAVMENTVNAALEDPRFPSVTKDEVGKIDIEISVMTPLAKVEKIEEIEVGKHGLVISRGWNRGLLLPQVATEWHWDRNQFLEAVSNKAGLDKSAWKDKASQIYKFSAIVFNEKELKK